MTWHAAVLTLFPDMFPGPLGHSLAGRALAGGEWSIGVHDLRPYGSGRHRAVDDTPCGGGAGMVLRPDVVDAAIRGVREERPENASLTLLYPTPRGRLLDQAAVRRFAAGPGLLVLCGRFEGVDERVLEANTVLEVSVGDYVLSGGECAALVLLDACVRLLPGVMGSASSAEEESFSDGLLEYPQYTRPTDWEGRPVPSVLLGGNHAAIAAWRREQSEMATRSRRPDLWSARARRARLAGIRKVEDR